MKWGIDTEIIVLIKQVPDPKEYVRIREDGTLDRERARAVINQCDRSALEAAIEIKEKIGAKITAISMGPAKAEDALREALAMGVDEAILISDRKLRGSDTLATSYVLQRAIRKIGHYDLILCGAETTDGGTGQVGPQVAEFLGVPQVTYVEEFEVKDEHVEAKRALEGRYELVRTRLPALLAITSGTFPPRNTTLSGIMKAVKKQVPIWSTAFIEAEDNRVGLMGSPTKIMKVEKVVFHRGNYVVKGETPAAIVDNLLGILREEGRGLVRESDGKGA
jgi:electron transfer flavoprotein alpha/beta subunit